MALKHGIHVRLAILLASAVLPCAAFSAPELPRIVARDGHHALIVDGKPFLMLAAQVNNSANYPAALAKVWP
ncbi:MAG TPA: hypothetical protein VNT42_12335, partial [Sphingomonas sp.]|nr:hypothetical protein [Sphingomonas sp.]